MIWAWRTIPSIRWMLYAGIVVIALLWFGIPGITSRTPFVAASNAFGSGRRLDRLREAWTSYWALYRSLVIPACALFGLVAARHTGVFFVDDSDNTLRLLH